MTLLTGLKHPTAVAVAANGKLYVAVDADEAETGGAVLTVVAGKAKPYSTGLDQPRAIVPTSEWVYVACRRNVRRVDRNGKVQTFAATTAFPSPPHALVAMDIDEAGNLYVADAGESKGEGGAIYRVDKSGAVTLVADVKRSKGLRSPAGLVMDGFYHLLVTDSYSGALLRIRIANGAAEEILRGTGGALAWDKHGRLYLVDAKAGNLLAIPRPGVAPVAMGCRVTGGLAVDPYAKVVLATDPEAGTLSMIPAAIPGWEVDESPLGVQAAVAFADLQWSGWKGEDERGRVVPLRPVVLTHAGDGSNRVFVGTQHGVIHVFPNDPKAAKTKVFLDISDKVTYNDNRNEEGFLGLAFHPDYKKNGEFFVFYTPKSVRKTNIISRFRVSKDDPDRADPASEEEILRITDRPFWNHDGGTIVFGPDGYLYIAIGDGGLANDPFQNGQNLGKLLAKVLRVDVNRKETGKNYSVPADNPFVQTPGARPEIWAYGLRNVWRMAFDRKTGKLWASDVGQNLYEEIDLIVRGGNYGWNLREGLHPFGTQGVGPRSDLIEPIWEYHHDVGKSLTGGLVYRGKRLPELDGHYLYADYVSAKIWALRYDDVKGRVLANHPIRDANVPVMSFGEDEQGEAYVLTYSATGKGIYQFVHSGPAKPQQ